MVAMRTYANCLVCVCGKKQTHVWCTLGQNNEKLPFRVALFFHDLFKIVILRPKPLKI